MKSLRFQYSRSRSIRVRIKKRRKGLFSHPHPVETFHETSLHSPNRALTHRDRHLVFASLSQNALCFAPIVALSHQDPLKSEIPQYCLG